MNCYLPVSFLQFAYWMIIFITNIPKGKLSFLLNPRTFQGGGSRWSPREIHTCHHYFIHLYVTSSRVGIIVQSRNDVRIRVKYCSHEVNLKPTSICYKWNHLQTPGHLLSLVQLFMTHYKCVQDPRIDSSSCDAVVTYNE